MDFGQLRLPHSMSPQPEQPTAATSAVPHQLDVHTYYVGTCLITRRSRRAAHKSARAKETATAQHHRKNGDNFTPASYSSAAWAGVPLVSLHPNSLSRRSNFGNRDKATAPSNGGDLGSNKDADEMLPISRLALHAHGPPLILHAASNGTNSPASAEDARSSASPSGAKRGADLLYAVLRRASPWTASGGEEEQESLSVSSCSESDGKAEGCSSSSDSAVCVASSSSEDGAPSSPPATGNLPRVIKPRRRRKKGCGTRHESTSSPPPAGVVTLKPYRPLCNRASKNSTCLSRAPLHGSCTCDCSRLAIANNNNNIVSGFCGGPSNECSNDDAETTGYSNVVCEVSARIVTTPTGIRDLEIKFHPGGVGFDRNLTNSYAFHDKLLWPVEQFEAPEPPQRPWIQITLPNKRKATCIFTVMCYNVLCDKYATRQLYGYCPSWALSWEYRRKSIMEEIRQYAADIISLQEVETEQFYNFFLPELQRDGYDGIFSPKSRAKTMTESDKKHVDGCAIFFRTSKFSLVKEHLVEFNQLAMANAEGSDDMLNRVMTKDNIGLAALLETKEGAFDSSLLPDHTQVHQPLLVCTAHIHWDPEYCDVKLIQTMMLMHELRYIVEDAIHLFRPNAPKADASSIPLLLCGDLNSLPYSGVIEFLSTGRIAADHSDFKELGYKDCLRKLSSPEKPNEYTHPFQIARAYGDDIMRYTNYTYDFKGVIDYVFYSKQHMSVLGVLGPLDSEWMKANKVAGCPHPHIPSDHFPLVVELEMSPSLPPATNGLLLRR